MKMRILRTTEPTLLSAMIEEDRDGGAEEI